jgi:polyphosphate:AMP phosphotransferase
MFETAELGLTVADGEYQKRVPALRERLLSIQTDLLESDLSVVIVFAGVDKGGKGESANQLCYFMDPRRIETHAYDRPLEEERERPEFWRFWRDLPPKGNIGIFLRAWYSKPLLQRAFGRIDDSEFERQLDRIVAFERMLSHDSTLILKFWMHLGREQQEARFKQLQQDPLQSWRLTKKDWRHLDMYDQFAGAGEHLIVATSRGHAQWTIIEATDANYRTLEVGEMVAEGIERELERRQAMRIPPPRVDPEEPEPGTEDGPQPTPTVLSSLDLTRALAKSEYQRRKQELQGRLNRLQRAAKRVGRSTVIVLEGWDASGKGGAGRMLTGALDARDYKMIQVAAPTDEEQARHYLWRFWRQLPRAGRVAIFDRSWYGRVLVERVEGFATEQEWQRAYGEINEFERELVDHGIVVVKYWLHVSPGEQARRFEARKTIPYKRWKLTEEDIRNRAKWPRYESAVHEMVQRTSTPFAPWTLVEAENKRFARIKVLETLCRRLEAVPQIATLVENPEGAPEKADVASTT